MKKVLKEMEYATMQKTVPLTKEFVVSQYVMLSQKGIEKCGFKTKAFSEPGPEWAEMIFNCRVRKDRPPFDIITGPVADDDINGILNMIEDVMLSLEQETSVKTTDDVLRDRFIKAAKWFRPKREFEQVALTNNDVISRILRFNGYNRYRLDPDSRSGWKLIEDTFKNKPDGKEHDNGRFDR